MEDDLLDWFEHEGLVRYAAHGDPAGSVVETVRGPLVALGPHDADFYLAPHPEHMRYHIKPLGEMGLEDYQAFMLSWLEHAVRAADVRCASCGKIILETTPDMADADTWDAIFMDKELVAWMIVHFDCKKSLARQLKGRHPFELDPRPAPAYDLSDETHGAAASAESGDTTAPAPPEEVSHG